MWSYITNLLRGPIEDSWRTRNHTFEVYEVPYGNGIWTLHVDGSKRRSATFFASGVDEEKAIQIYVRSFTVWDSPFQEEVIDDEDRDRMIVDIIAGYQKLGYLIKLEDQPYGIRRLGETELSIVEFRGRRSAKVHRSGEIPGTFDLEGITNWEPPFEETEISDEDRERLTAFLSAYAESQRNGAPPEQSPSA